MGDISAEPSMEDILSSIKRIIAEDGDVAASPRPRRVPRPSVAREHVPAAELDSGEVLELSDRVVDDLPAVEVPMPSRAESRIPTDSILSETAAQASRGALDSLSRLVVKPTPEAEAAGADTLEGMVRDMLRPMLREWLDAKLPGLVEDMVAKEIARITQGR